MIEFRHILCPIDFSESSIRALTYAASFAAWYKGDLEVLHVEPALDAVVISATGDEVEHGRSSRPVFHQEIISRIEQVIAAAGVADVNRRVFAQEGRAYDAILARAKAQRADLIVMGTHGRSGINRLLLGSVTEKILRAAPCPVLTVPPAAHSLTDEPVTLKRILCPIDHSPSSLRAKAYALDLGRQSGGCVTFLNVLDYTDAEDGLELPPFDPCFKARDENHRRREQLIAEARERLHAQLSGDAATWCDIEEVVTTGRAGAMIVRHAKDSKADVIIMGAQGTAGIELMLYGSNTQHVVRAAACPVMTVHA